MTLLKPYQKEGRITLNEKQRAKKRKELFIAQSGICMDCHLGMIWEQGFLNTATLDHRLPQPAGCKKDDRDENLRAICWSCNGAKGSRRLPSMTISAKFSAAENGVGSNAP